MVLVDPLLGFEWYRRNLRTVYPDLQIPATAANHRRMNLCRTQVTEARVLTCALLAVQP